MRKYEHSPNSILVFKEKHCERYFLVPTVEALHKAALMVVLERNEEGYWYNFDEEAPIKPKMEKDDAERFGESVANTVKREWEQYNYDLRSYNKSLRLKAMLSKILSEKDGQAALNFLQDMSDNEYEGFEIIEGESYE